MKTSDFFFELPESLIAQYPPAERGQSRLMVLDRGTGKRERRAVKDLPLLLEKETLLVFNNSRVRKARLFGTAENSGARAEFLLLNKLPPAQPAPPEQPEPAAAPPDTLWRAMAQRAKRRRRGSRYEFPGGVTGEIVAEDGEFRFIKFDRPVNDAWLDIHGHIPLPPYIRRGDAAADSERYQTVYSKGGASFGAGGSVAAPTAGLHFTREILARLEKAGMETAFITLHVGPGTFLPVRAKNIEDHIMHEETYTIDDETAAKIEKAKASGRKILAVGTTTVRTLESSWQKEAPAGKFLKRGEGTASIFIYPGYTFAVVDQLFTNFHTPGSTLLMLTAAFAGKELILDTYAQAVKEGYRFFSYGDAMLIR
ncbi:MAG: tRNA preQ1(34) S-adenosylmethionine ribosyltransferase-isomerase QueA [Treponema sp.]|jgi:S-adenosylmethionine:tRNA ribosyltransferase-isomerase|nr:tRNA preQ1(34) S-adenosylmethionine ribosyltransferase-isomerase QueA [Treponema sp.]